MADELWQRRFLLLVTQYEEEQGSAWGWKSRLAERVGLDASTINKLTTNARTVTMGMVNAAITKYPIDPSFFYDATLGDKPDHRHFVGTRVDRDDAKGTQNAEAYIAAMASKGEPVSPEHARRLRSVRMSDGDMPIGAFELAHRSMLAEDAGRALPPRPGPSGKVDEERGQRKLPPSTKKVR